MRERNQHEIGHSSKVKLLGKPKPNVILVILIQSMGLTPHHCNESKPAAEN